MYALLARLVLYAEEIERPHLVDVASDIICTYLQRQAVRQWICEHGGWDAFVTKYGKPQHAYVKKLIKTAVCISMIILTLYIARKGLYFSF